MDTRDRHGRDDTDRSGWSDDTDGVADGAVLRRCPVACLLVRRDTVLSGVVRDERRRAILVVPVGGVQQRPERRRHPLAEQRPRDGTHAPGQGHWMKATTER